MFFRKAATLILFTATACPSAARVGATLDAGRADDTGGEVQDSASSRPDAVVLPPDDAGAATEYVYPPGVRTNDGIHIATSGNDSGDGSVDRPYRSIQYVLDNVAEPGSTLVIHAGLYNEAVRIRRSNMTLQSPPGERAHISCPVSIDESDPPLCVHIDAETTGTTLRGLEVSGGFYSVFLGSQWDWDETPTDNAAANHVVIEDCVLHDSGRDVVKIPAGCDDITIQNTEIYNSGMGYPEGTALDDKNAEGIDAVNADRVRVSDSYIHNTATTCVYVKGGSIGTVIERTRVEHCGALGISLGFDTSPEFFDLTVNPGYYENIGGIVRNCIVKDTGLAGIALYATRDASVLHNTIIGAGSVGHAGLYFGVATQDYDPKAGRPANLNPTVVGNIVDQSGMSSPRCFGIRYSEDDELGILSGLQGEATLRDNLYYAGGGACLFDDGRPSVDIEDVDFAAWQAAEGDPGSLMTNPMLDETGRLRAGSPAIDSLDATGAVSYDVDGERRSGRYDRGADERGGQ